MLREASVTVLIVAAALLAAVPETAAYPPAGYWSSGPYTGRVAYPAAGEDLGHLVVVAKGVDHVADDYWLILPYIASHGAVAVAVDYADFDADFGADAILAAVASFGAGRTITMYAVSGGGPAATLAMLESPGTFRWLVNVETVTNLDETYLEAKAAAAAVSAAGPAVAEIEAECGSPAAIACLGERSMALQSGGLGISGVFQVHSVNDGLVPYNQAVEFRSILEAGGIPVDLATLTVGSVDPEWETTATGHATRALGLPDVPAPGHASEDRFYHPLVQRALEAVVGIVEGTYTPGSGLDSLVGVGAPELPQVPDVPLP